MFLDKSYEETIMMYENISERIHQFQIQIINNNKEIFNKYIETYNIINKNIIDNITNRTNFINKDVIENTESFYKSIEITQRYFNDTIQNYFNFIRN